MLYFVGVSVFAMGPGHAALADNKTFAMLASLALLALLTVLNVVGLGVGKWLNNMGAIGTFIAAAVLIGLGSPSGRASARTSPPRISAFPPIHALCLNSFGVICFGLVGLEFASVMGDEIRDPQKTLPGAVAWGGVISGALYIGATLTLWSPSARTTSACCRASCKPSATWRAKWAWLGSSRRLRSCSAFRSPASARPGWAARRAFPSLPGSTPTCRRGWGKCIRGMQRPHAALIVQAIVSLVLIVINFMRRAACRKPSRPCCRWRWCCNSCRFCMCLRRLLKFAVRGDLAGWPLWPGDADVCGLQRFSDHRLGIVLAFFPRKHITSVWKYEVKMFGLRCFFWGSPRSSFSCMDGERAAEQRCRGSGRPQARWNGRLVRASTRCSRRHDFMDDADRGLAPESQRL